MSDEPNDPSAAPERPGAEPSNVVPFPSPAAKPRTAEEFLDALKGLAAKVEPVVEWISTEGQRRNEEISKLTDTVADGFAVMAKAQADAVAIARAQDQTRAELAALAAKVELLEHPNPEIRTAAAEAAAGNPDAINELAAKLEQQPSWWRRNRGVLLTIGLTLALSALVIAIGSAVQRRRLEAQQRRFLEQQIRWREAEYLQLHGAYVRQQNALAAEQARPLQASYDQRSFPTYNSTTEQHEHYHQHDEHKHRQVINPDDLADELAPRIAGLIPPSTTTTILQPTQHTIDKQHTREIVREKQRGHSDAETRAIAAAKRAERAASAAAQHASAARRERAATLDDGAAVTCVASRSRLVDEYLAKQRKT